jgi:hypothetical protein
VLRNLTLFLVSLMSASALGMGTNPAEAHLESAYVMLFLAAVAGVVATSVSRSILAETKGRREAPEDAAEGAPPAKAGGALSPVLAGLALPSQTPASQP